MALNNVLIISAVLLNEAEEQSTRAYLSYIGNRTSATVQPKYHKECQKMQIIVSITEVVHLRLELRNKNSPVRLPSSY